MTRTSPFDPRDAQDAQLFALLESIVDRKLATDQVSGSEPFDDCLVECEEYPDGKDAFLRQLLRCQRYGFQLLTEKRDALQLDRRASLVSGPLYTNVEYPWPTGPRGPAEPLFQVDLAWAGGIGGIELGQGLIQVWMDDSEAIVRTVPPESIHSHDPAPATACSAAFGEPNMRNVYSAEAIGSGRATWMESGHQVIGVGGRRRDVHQAIPRFLESEVVDRADEYHPAIVSDAKMALGLLQRADSIIWRQTSTDGFLFGNYHPWNWDANLAGVLVNFESGETFRFHDEGQGTLLYETDGPNCSFEFSWGT